MPTAYSRHGSASSTSSGNPWQDRLEEYCREAKLAPPTYQIVSDRRGGRTAWSSRVTIGNQTIGARYWYDGKNLNNAREDAAECAINMLLLSHQKQSAQQWSDWNGH